MKLSDGIKSFYQFSGMILPEFLPSVFGELGSQSWAAQTELK